MEQQSYWVQTTDQQRLYVKTWGNANNPALVWCMAIQIIKRSGSL
jgi:hypothetical protein